MLYRCHGALILALFLGWCQASALANPPAENPESVNAELSAEALDFFEREVRPVLAEHCYRCHGSELQRAGLRMDNKASFFAGGDSGPAIVPGNADGSRLVQAIRYTGRLMMPPDQKLPDEAVEAISQWITMGAPWPEEDGLISAPVEEESKSEWIERLKRHHWAFSPVADVAPPETVHPDWSDHAIDRFVAEKLEEKGLEPSMEADRHTLLRRLYFDLTGLPPSPEAVAAFEADTSPDAFEKVVDALLETPQFGERWARYWLDIARYADTKGYVFQEDRFFPYSYTYRDYVINAFNRDLPYDEFIRHQIAADMMEIGDDKEALAGLGFLTLGRRFINNIHDITDDRIDVVTRGFLGLTVSCARCHDHMYDPITADDYYSLYGVFRSAQEPGELPLIREPDPEDPLYQEYLAAVQTREDELNRVTDEIHSGLMKHARDKFADYFRVAFHGQDAQSDDAIKLLAKEKELDWQLLKRWRDYLGARIGEPDEFWRPLAWYAALPESEFAAQSSELTERIRANNNPEEPINGRLVEAFGGPAPEAIGDVLRRYISGIRKAQGAWLDLLATQSQRLAKEGAAPELPVALPNPHDEAFRLVLYGVESPANIPRDDTFALSDVPTQGRIRNARNAIANTKATHPGRPDRAMALVDAATPFDPYVFNRGKPEARGADVPRRFLEVLTGPDAAPFEQGSGRLELADAIADPSNPLTARVFANRAWGFLMGRYLVDTPSDFGLRSSPPSHPELLDYLATYFVEHGWSMKALIRNIVTSQTYRQSSDYVARIDEIDPENRYYARQTRKRLDFEALRDSILLASGNLDKTLFGHSVDITQAPYPVRRTVYSFIERQNLPGVFRTFDFASPDAHSPARFRTTVPQQALYMMNSPFVVQQARALAARPHIEGEEAISERVTALYQTVFQRAPDAEELGLALRFLETALATHPEGHQWRYGYGGFDGENEVVSFTSFPHFSGRSWKGEGALPDEQLGWASLTRDGGHPGKPGFDTVLRWVAPISGEVAIDGELRHGNDKGDGVEGRIVLNGRQVLWQDQAFNSGVAGVVPSVSVNKGDTIDFIVSCRENESFDGYSWKPAVRLLQSEEPVEDQNEEWIASNDFRGPPPAPLDVWEQYAQVLLLSNEFAFVD